MWSTSGCGCHHAPCSLGLVWLISHTFSANEPYFFLTPNQPTVLSAIAYHPNRPKPTGSSNYIYLSTLYTMQYTCIVWWLACSSPHVNEFFVLPFAMLLATVYALCSVHYDAMWALHDASTCTLRFFYLPLSLWLTPKRSRGKTRVQQRKKKKLSCMLSNSFPLFFSSF